MFRCITELKGLVVDIDSICTELEEWVWAFEKFQCVFITSRRDNVRLLRKLYGEDCVYQIEEYLKLFSPSRAMHEEVLKRMHLNTTEIAYVTGDKEFSNNAIAFMCGNIWITKEKITYEDVSIAPDLIFGSFEAFKKRMEEHIYGFYGEMEFLKKENKKGYILPVVMETEEEYLYIFMLGRYFGYSHYMNQLHPYSSAIYLNKREGKAYGLLDDRFTKLFVNTINQIKKSQNIDTVCAVPVRPGKPERFKGILQSISQKCEITDVSDKFQCIVDYPVQKNLSEVERQKNVKEVFQYEGDLNEKNVVIIEDIITTGATIKECVRILKKSGANRIYVVALGINQKKGNYWSSTDPQVSCPQCGEEMILFINSKTKQFFYSCLNCKQTINCEEGYELLCLQVDSEFNATS